MSEKVSTSFVESLVQNSTNLLPHSAYFPLSYEQYLQAKVLGLSDERLKGIQKRMIEGKSLHQKILESRAQYEASKKSPAFLGNKNIPNSMWGETYKKWGEILIQKNTDTWEEQFLTLYYYFDFSEYLQGRDINTFPLTQEEDDYISEEMKEYRQFLFLVHMHYEMPEIKRLPRLETIRLWKKENKETYLHYLGLCRKYYETREKGEEVTLVPYADYDSKYCLLNYNLQKGEKGNIHKKIFPNIGIIPQEKMSLHVDFLEEIYILSLGGGRWVDKFIAPSPEILDHFIRRHADKLEENIDALSPIQFDPKWHKHIENIIKRQKEQREREKNIGQEHKKVANLVQEKVHQIGEIYPIEKKKVIYDSIPEIHKNGIYKKYKRKAIDIVKKWEQQDERKLWIFSVQKNTWHSYEKDEEIPHESTPSGEYEFCFALEDAENKGFPAIDPLKKTKYVIENEKKIQIPSYPIPVNTVQKSVVRKVDTVVPEKYETIKDTRVIEQEEEAFSVFLLLEEGNYSIKKVHEKIIFHIGETFITYHLKKDQIVTDNPFIEELCNDILRNIVKNTLEELEFSKKEHTNKRKEKYVRKQLDQIQVIERGIGEYLEGLPQEDISFGEYMGTQENIFSLYRSSTGGFLGTRILDQAGILHSYRVALQKILHQNKIILCFYRPAVLGEHQGVVNSSSELSISLQRRNRSKIIIQSIPESPYYLFSFPDGMDYRIQEGWGRVLKNILILIGEVSRRSMLPKNTKAYRSLPNKEKMQAYITGTYKKEYSWEKLPGKEREIRLEAYRRLLLEKGKIITDTGEIKTRQGLSHISTDTKIVVHDMSIKPGFTEEGSKKAYEMIRSGEARLKRYLMKRIFATLNQGSLNGKRVFSNGMGAAFQLFWKELPEGVRQELIAISQTGDGSTDRAMEIKVGEKTIIDALLDYWESHHVLLSISSPSYIFGKDILDNISFLKLSETH